MSILACSKQGDDKMDITSIDQVTGEWQWLSTCGGIIENCTYASDTNFAVIDFGPSGKYVELHNGAVYLEADYIVVKTDETTGTLRFNSYKTERFLKIVNNQLEISRGELVDTYKKLK